jgi:hypothetical protein
VTHNQLQEDNMKQLDDTFTIDMHGDTQVITPDNSNTRNVKTYHRFYVKSHDGLTTEWTGLSKKQARDMYAYTNAHHPCNVTGTGWEELK